MFETAMPSFLLGLLIIIYVAVQIQVVGEKSLTHIKAIYLVEVIDAVQEYSMSKLVLVNRSITLFRASHHSRS